MDPMLDDGRIAMFQMSGYAQNENIGPQLLAIRCYLFEANLSLIWSG